MNRRTSPDFFTRLAWLTVAVVLSGCEAAPQPSPPRRSPAKVLRECVESSSAKLDAALAAGDVTATAREIVKVLDQYEDFPASHPYQEFHRNMEQLESLASKGATNEELQTKIDELKQMADTLLSETAE